MINVKRIKVCLWAAIAVAAFACTKDVVVDDHTIVPDDNKVSTDVVTFGFNFENSWAPDIIDDAEPDQYDAETAAVDMPTRSGAVLMECDKDGDLGKVYMYMVEDNIPAQIESSDETRAGEGEGRSSSTPTYDGIGVIAFHTTGEGQNTSTTTFMNNINLGEYNNNTYWPGTGSIDFYAYSPHRAYDATGNYQITVNNNVPMITYSVPTTISEQLDLVDGYAHTDGFNEGQSVQISMSHLLSQIQVKLGTIDMGRITNITIGNVCYHGTHTLNEKDSNGVTLWDVDNSHTSYVQSNAEGLANDSTNGIVGLPMYLMPQTLGAEAEIVVTIEVPSTDQQGVSNPTYDNKTTYTLTKKLKDLTANWKPNKRYTYIISTPQEIEVSVTDEVVAVEGGAPQKKNLVITNSGLASAYIRLEMVGAWCVDNTVGGVTETLVVGDWKDTDGTFNWGNTVGEPTTGATTNNWRKGSDGYYYYMRPIGRGQTIEGDDALFQTYTLQERGPMANSFLEFTIMVQAVTIADAQILWDSAIWALLNQSGSN